MAHTWSEKDASSRIQKLLNEVQEVEVLEYTRDMSLENIPKNRAYRNDSVHLYIDITNIDEILENTNFEGTLSHKRTLRFLNQHYRAVHRILDACDTLKIDFHNQRLHAVIFKPYDSEEDRIKKAVAIGQLITDVLKETGKQNDDEEKNIPAATVCVGIDSGISLIVNNGRRQGKEPLFLGPPANEAAKLASEHSNPGIYLSNNARKAIGLAEVNNPKKTKLTNSEIEACQTDAELPVSKDKIIKDWEQDLENNPIGKFDFSGHTPPMRNLDIMSLTPSNSRRQEMVSIYADIDGFTKFIANHIEENTEDVIKIFHVIRSELDNVLTLDFEGRKIRFIGDCLHGVFCLGTAQITETENTISEAVLCCGGLRSSFDLALQKLEDAGIDVSNLGLQIGFDYGQTAITRLGIKGSMVRCAMSRSVLNSEDEQGRCNSESTAIGKTAYDKARQSVRDLFGATRMVANLDYLEAVESLAENDSSAKSAKNEAFATSKVAVAEAAYINVRPHCK